MFEQEWRLIRDAQTGDRIVPLNPTFPRALQQNLPAHGHPTELVLGGIDWIKDSWPKVRKEAGLEDLHFHDLRATDVTRISEAGFPRFTARAVAGHANIKTTGIHARPSLERIRQAVAALANNIPLQPGQKAKE